MGPEAHRGGEPRVRILRRLGLGRDHKKRPTCESRLDIDVRDWHGDGLLRSGQAFSISWSRGGEPLGNINVDPLGDAVVLLFHRISSGKEKSQATEQRVPIVWSRCHFGGFRPWFRCPEDAADGQGR
jgi:hypothetical protein